jgi:peptidyl-prolyl cis-trans isomerase D
MAKVKSAKIISKKHLARQERERRQTRLITAVSAAVILLVVLLIGYGILYQTVLLPLRAIVTVNGEKYSIKDFQAEVRATRQQYISQYLNYEQYSQFGLDLSSQMSQISSTLDDTTTLGQQVLSGIEDRLLIRQYALANGITVTEADVEKEIQNQFGYYSEGTPTPAATSTTIVYPTLSTTQLALMTPTLTPSLTPTRTLYPTATPDLSATPSSTPSITPSPTPYTLSGFQKNYDEILGQYTKLGMSDSQFRRVYFEDVLYRQKVTEKVTADVSHQQEQVHLRQILVNQEKTADDVYNQLQAGADFTELAATYSLDSASKDKGGDLGWLSADSLTTQYGSTFQSTVFGMSIGEIGQPIQTTYGWQVVQVLGHEIRPFTENEYQTAISNAFDAWLQGQRDTAVISEASDWATYVPTTPTIDAVKVEMATAAAQTQAALPTSTPTIESSATQTPQ